MSRSASLFAFAASHRADSINRLLAVRAAAMLQEAGLTADMQEYAAFDTPLYDENLYDRAGVPEGAKHFAAMLSRHDGMVLASPEYNWSYPGALKNLIDWMSRLRPLPCAGKTALLLCASPSTRGGLTGLLHLKTVLEALDMQVYSKMFALGSTHETLAADGTIRSQKHANIFAETLRGFADFTTRLHAK